MCTKIPTCNEMVSFTNLPCFSTMRRFGIPILKGAEPEESLVVYTKTNEFGWTEQESVLRSATQWNLCSARICWIAWNLA